MPRLARLDAPGVLHHIMIRGIERRKTFRDNKDRDDFIERLSIILPETDTSCYAWALISSHAHFLFRSGESGIAKVMRRLLTGYAIGFNWIQKSTSSWRGQGQLALPGHSVQGSVGVLEYWISVWLDCLKHFLV